MHAIPESVFTDKLRIKFLIYIKHWWWKKPSWFCQKQFFKKRSKINFIFSPLHFIKYKIQRNSSNLHIVTIILFAYHKIPTTDIKLHLIMIIIIYHSQDALYQYLTLHTVIPVSKVFAVHEVILFHIRVISLKGEFPYIKFVS